MLQADEIPQFRGDESPEDAKKWLKHLVATTGSFSDSGILRLLSTQLEDESPAMDWYETLDEDLKTSWTGFQRQFRDRWIRSQALRTHREDQWDAFQNHKLTHGMMFGDSHTDPVVSHSTMVSWAKAHLLLGKETNRVNSVLIETTERLLPSFILAYIQFHAKPPSTFDGFCTAIKEIPLQTVQLERIRIQLTLNDWQAVMDGKINAMAQKIDQLLFGRSGVPSGKATPHSSKDASELSVTEHASSATSVVEEPCSPRLSVISMEGTPDEKDDLQESLPLDETPSKEDCSNEKGSLSENGTHKEEDASSEEVTPRGSDQNILKEESIPIEEEPLTEEVTLRGNDQKIPGEETIPPEEEPPSEKVRPHGNDQNISDEVSIPTEEDGRKSQDIPNEGDVANEEISGEGNTHNEERPSKEEDSTNREDNSNQNSLDETSNQEGNSDENGPKEAVQVSDENTLSEEENPAKNIEVFDVPDADATNEGSLDTSDDKATKEEDVDTLDDGATKKDIDKPDDNANKEEDVDATDDSATKEEDVGTHDDNATKEQPSGEDADTSPTEPEPLQNLSEDGPPDVPEDQNDSEDSDFLVPSDWRKPRCAMTKNDIIDLSRRAMSFLLTFRRWFSAKNILIATSAIVVLGKVTDDVTIDVTDVTKPVDGGTGDDKLWRAIYNVHKYRLHNNSESLKQAESDWSGLTGSQEGFHSVIKSTQTKVSVGDRPPVDLHLQPSGEPTMAGGMCTGNASGDAFVISSSRTILLTVLSCYLAECTGEPKYREAATLSAKCITTHMLDSETSLAKDCLIDPVTGKEKDGGISSCHLTGMVIEAFSILACVTEDDSWGTKAIEIAKTAMYSDKWHGSDGILSVGTEGTASEWSDVKAQKGLLNRGLLVAYERNPLNLSFRKLVSSYINVQFNALYDLSCNQNTYGVNWRGPYAGPYGHAQMAALDTMIAAIGVNA